VDFPDVISPLDGATIAMNYSTGGGAAIQYASGSQRLVTLGFPFETITSSTVRTSVMNAVLSYFGLKPATSSFQGTSSNDTYSVSFNQLSNTIEVLEQLAGAAPRASIFAHPGLNQLQFNTFDGDDQVTLNLAGISLEVRMDGGLGSDQLTLNSGTINLQPIAAGPMTLENLAVNPSAVLNLAAETLVLRPPAAQRETIFNSLVPLLQSGRNGGSWNGPGINSSTAAADSRRITGLALVINTQGEIFISYKLIGDLDLDGDLDADDYARIDAGFAARQPNYQNGDLNYSGGPPNADDFFLIDRAFTDQSSPISPAASSTVIRLTKRPHARKAPHHPRHRTKCIMFRRCWS